MWIVDSSVWIDYFRGRLTAQTETLNAALGQEDVGLGDIILDSDFDPFEAHLGLDVVRQV